MITNIQKAAKNKYLVKVSNSIYDRDAIVACTYKFSGKASIFLNDTSNAQTEIYFTFADDEKEANEETLINNFIDGLSDAQMRLHVEKEFGHIRDAIVKKAFSSITK